MAAIFYNYITNSGYIFKDGLTINNAVQINLLNGMISNTGFLIVTEVTMQHRDTVQYFLTFDDFISYMYFGKGLGSISISGSMFSTCDTSSGSKFPSLDTLMNNIGQNRGKLTTVMFGNTAFDAVLSSFTLRASSDDFLINMIDFNLQLDITNSHLNTPQIASNCQVLSPAET